MKVVTLSVSSHHRLKKCFFIREKKKISNVAPVPRQKSTLFFFLILSKDFLKKWWKASSYSIQRIRWPFLHWKVCNPNLVRCSHILRMVRNAINKFSKAYGGSQASLYDEMGRKYSRHSEEPYSSGTQRQLSRVSFGVV